ncbi:lycopene cyclase domain-containing protein [Aestuariimicrobium kwangyangense]|uniref:lycopene cyclase domain-containing protein n=1 Tax=Aestuariimicrobium kwangyangense TaxID=396389 RepID=UPI0003B3D483|nr:lycopene cyclase domain-containing protein [Aestuariimicrobium kwangyangense]
MNDHLQYLGLMAACLVLTLPLEFVLRARVYRRPLRLLVSLLPTVAVFVAWDVLGIIRDHWSYSPRFSSGLMIGPMPLEELVFFIVIPICGLLTYEAVGTVLDRVRPDRAGRGLLRRERVGAPRGTDHA